MTTVSAALARWTQHSNRKRALETFVRTLPWLAAAGVVAAYAYERAGVAPAAVIGGVLVGAALIAAIRRQRAVRHAPASLARSLDAQHHTVDLLQTALALETNPRSAWDPDNIDPLVLARAHEIVPEIAPVAVPPLKLRASPFAGLTVVAACSLFLLTGADHRADEAAAGPALGQQERAKASELEKAIDEMAQDPALSKDARAKLQAAKHALERAAAAHTGKAALAEMSEAQRLLDEVAPHMDQPKPAELAKLSRDKLAEQLAQAAKSGDSAAMAALSKEAMRRAATSPAEAAAMADAMKAAAMKAGSKDPWGEQNLDASTPEGKRLAELAAAAEKMKLGDTEAMKAAMSELAKMGKPGSSSSARMASARRMLAEMRAAERSELNGTEMADARAEAAREAARGMSRSGMGTRAGMGMGSGMGSGKGMGRGMGMGMGSGGKGMGMGMGMGMGSGMGSGGSSTGLNVLAGAQPPGGAAGSSGAHGGTTPSGATAPETVEAEEVDTPPPAALSPEGVIRAIAEHAAGEHVSEAFGPVRDKYEAIAEAAIHRDEIPLTRRDFIQRYFEALRNTGTEDQ